MNKRDGSDFSTFRSSEIHIMSDPMDTSTKVDSNTSFITSNKARRLLVLNENVYRCNKKTARKKYWKCIVSCCTMSVHTDENDVYICGGKTNHDHQPNSDLVQTKRLLCTSSPKKRSSKTDIVETRADTNIIEIKDYRNEYRRNQDSR